MLTEADREAWNRLVASKLYDAFGPVHETILHVIVSDPDYGPFDTRFFRNHIAGTLMVTIGLARPGTKRGGNSAYETCEYVIATRNVIGIGASLGDLSSTTPDGLKRVALNEIAAYAADTTVESGSTLEFPNDYDGDVGGRCFIITDFETDSFSPEFGVMLVIEIHRDEMVYAMEQGGEALITKLKSAGVFPFSEIERPSVVSDVVN